MASSREDMEKKVKGKGKGPMGSSSSSSSSSRSSSSSSFSNPRSSTGKKIVIPKHEKYGMTEGEYAEYLEEHRKAAHQLDEKYPQKQREDYPAIGDIYRRQLQTIDEKLRDNIKSGVDYNYEKAILETDAKNKGMTVPQYQEYQKEYVELAKEKHPKEASQINTFSDASHKVGVRDYTDLANAVRKGTTLPDYRKSSEFQEKLKRIQEANKKETAEERHNRILAEQRQEGAPILNALQAAGVDASQYDVIGGVPRPKNLANQESAYNPATYPQGYKPSYIPPTIKKSTFPIPIAEAPAINPSLTRPMQIQMSSPGEQPFGGNQLLAMLMSGVGGESKYIPIHPRQSISDRILSHFGPQMYHPDEFPEEGGGFI